MAFMDITIQTYNITQDEFNTLKGYHDYNSSENSDVYLQLDDIKSHIKGHGRIVVYTSLSKTQDGKWDANNLLSNQIDSLIEGNFVDATLQGFGRIMYQGATGSIYKCRWGFFLDNQLDGKGIYYTAGVTTVVQGLWQKGTTPQEKPKTT